MKIVIAPDSFKGSLTSIEGCNIIEKAALSVFSTAEIVKIPIADGGEGSIEAVSSACKGEIVSAQVQGSLPNTTLSANYFITGKKGVVEMAQANGLTLIEEKNPLLANTYGTGELILHAINRGCTEIVVAIGGSATNDGGLGAMQALGFSFYDDNDKRIDRVCGQNLSKIRRISDENALCNLKAIKFTVMCDVNNPLTGKKGATYTFGRQKGADDATLAILEKGMKNYENVLNSYAGFNVGEVEGTGAAGGLGGALKGFLKAEMKPGILAVLELAKFKKKIKNANLIITGEGRVDFQSAYGKVLWGIGKSAEGIPVIAFAGGVGEGIAELEKIGINAVIPIVNKPMELKEAIGNAKNLLYNSAVNTFKLLKISL